MKEKIISFALDNPTIEVLATFIYLILAHLKPSIATLKI